MSLRPTSHPTRLAGALVAVGLVAVVVLGLDLGDGREPGSRAPAPARDRSDRPAAGQLATVRIPGGRYEIGSALGGRDERPVHSVTLSAFRIDRFEVTNTRFARFLNALGVRPERDADAGAVGADSFRAQDAGLFIEGEEGEERRPLIALDDEHARIAVRGGRFVAAADWADHPVTESTWTGARRYAAWAGGRLPTEVEWEAAARGRAGRTYPWGEELPTSRRAVLGRGSGETLPVGSRPAGATPERIHDLAGNVDEWTSSLYRPYPYRERDGRELPGRRGEERVTRGGNHVYSTANELRSAYRAGFSREPDRGHRHIGFRVIYPDSR